MPKINSLEVVHQDTNKDSYDNLHDLLVKFKKFYDESAGKEVIDGEARAAYEVLMEMYVNDKEAFAKRIETLSAKFGNSLAQIVEEMLAYASASEAYAKKITTVSAEVETSNAMIQNEMYVRATADEALATQINTISATVGSKNRTYYQTTAPSSGMVAGDLWIDSDDNKLYRYSGSGWSNIQDSQIGVNTAAISNESTARSTADGSLATSINAVTARLDTGDFAAVKTESSATASKVTGIEARWGVTTNVNGYVAGIQLLNGGSTQSSFIVDATKFIVKKPDGTNGIAWNGTNSRLDISGDVYANAFYGNVIGTGNINNNAVSTSSTVSGYGTSSAVTSINTFGSRVHVTVAFWNSSTANTQFTVARGSTTLVSESAASPFVSFTFVDTPPTDDTHTYTAYATQGQNLIQIQLLGIKK